MGENIDRLYIVSHAGKHRIRPMKFRYLSKSILASCKGDGESFEYINFRGAHFSKCTFKNAFFKGCDFWGTTFKKCKFNNAVFQDCVFQGCKFNNGDFSSAKLQYSAIVNTNTDEYKDLVLEDTTVVLKEYPEVDFSEKMKELLEKLKENKDLRKTKVFWISDKKPNNLNLFLLLRKYSASQIEAYLEQITNREARRLTTYGSVNFGLNKLVKRGIIPMSRPTQSRGCDAYGLGDKDRGL